MNEVKETKDLQKLARQIRTTHWSVLDCERNWKDTRKKAVEFAIKCGKQLIEAKEAVGHGEWGKWIKDSFGPKGLSKKTAQNYMRLCYAKEQHVADLDKATTLRQAYVAAGIISKPNRPEPSEFVKAKGLAVQLWNLLVSTHDPDRMAAEIEAVLSWHRDYIAQKQKKEAAVNDGFVRDGGKEGFTC